MDEFEVPCAKVATITDVLNNPQLRHRGQIADIPHPTVGSIPIQGVTIHLSGTPLTIRSGQPDVGQNTAEVLQEWLGAHA